MVTQRGQSASEFIIVLALLTGLGIAILNGFTTQKTGAVDQMQTNAVNKVVADPD